MRTFKVVLVLLFISVNIDAGTAVNDKNWRTHPEILKIRKICNEVIALKNTIMESKRCDDEEALMDEGLLKLSATIHMDSKGMVRRYIVEGGGDFVFESEYFYDKNGVLRFIYDQFRSPGDINIEDRLYFNEKGDEIYTHHQTKGNGWPLDSKQISNPKEHFKKLCNKQE